MVDPPDNEAHRHHSSHLVLTGGASFPLEIPHHREDQGEGEEPAYGQAVSVFVGLVCVRVCVFTPVCVCVRVYPRICGRE